MNAQSKVRHSAVVAGMAAVLALGACAKSDKPAPAASEEAKTAEAAVDTTAAYATVGDVPASDPAELAAFRKATKDLYTLKEHAFAEGKVDPIVKRFYAKNAVSVGPEGKPIVGRAAFDADYQHTVPRYNVRVVPYQTFVKGDAGWDWATFYVTPKDPKSGEKPFSFAILFLWAKVDGRWVCGGDMYVIGSFETAK